PSYSSVGRRKDAILGTSPDSRIDGEQVFSRAGALIKSMNIRRAVSKRLLPAAMIGVLASAVSVYGQLSFSRLGVTTGLAVDVSKNGSVVAIDAGRAIRWTRATG